MTSTRDYSLVGTSTEAALAAGLATAEWYKSPVPRARMKELMRRSDHPALRDTLLWLGIIVASGTGIALLWWSWWCVPLLVVYGVMYGSASDSLWHEAGHGTAFRTYWLNTVVYQIACFMIMRNPTVWRWSHTRHHTDTIIVGRDAEIAAMRPPRLGVMLANYFGLVDVPRLMRAMLRHASGWLNADERDLVPEQERSKAARVARVWVAIYAVTIGLAIATTSVVPLVLVGLPRMYGAWHHVVTGYTQHAGLDDNVLDHRLNTRSVYMNRINRFIYSNMNYHVEHHMFPMVPYHQLPALHAEIRHDLPPAARSILAAYRELVPVVLRQRREPEYCIVRELPTHA